MKRFLKILGGNRSFFALTLAVGLIFSAVSVVTPVLSGRLITAVTDGIGHAGGILAAFLLVSLGQIVFSQLDRYLSESLKIRQKGKMRKALFGAVSRKNEMGAQERSEVVSFLNNDVPGIAEDYVCGIVDMAKCAALLLLSSLSLLSIHWLLALIIILVSVLIITVPKLMQKRSGKARDEFSQQLSRYNASLLSFLGGLPLLKTYLYRGRAVRLQNGENEAVQQKEKALLGCKIRVYGATAVLQVVKTSAILCVGAWLIANGAVTVGSLVAVLQLAEMISSPIEVLAYLFHARNEALPLCDKYETFTAPCGNPQGKSVVFAEVPEIRVENLTFSIGELAILKNVSVRFEQGKKYLITGESGSGKSTLLRLLAGMEDENCGGSILCGGKSIREIDASSYYSAVCVVPQEPYLFTATLEENILLGREISREDYRTAIRKLNLEYLVARFGSREITAEDIESFSGGERQRIAIARAVLGKPKIYLLDEVTSALDVENAAAVEQLFLSEPATVIHVSHKAAPQLLSRYDAHFVMSGGELSLLV